MTPIEGDPNPNGDDCVACGRCCHHPPKTVSLLEADEQRMGALLPIYTEVEPKPPYFRFVKNEGARCGALDVSKSGQYPCAIYAVRPEGCRTVEPGSPCCLEARRLGHLGSSVEFKRVVGVPAEPGHR